LVQLDLFFKIWLGSLCVQVKVLLLLVLRAEADRLQSRMELSSKPLILCIVCGYPAVGWMDG